MDTFMAIPSSTAYTPFSPSTVVVEDIVTPIIPAKPILSVYPRVVTNIGIASVFQPSTAFYYDSGIGENPLAQHETNSELRYEFLDKWLYEDYPDILRMMKVSNGKVKVVSADEARNNDISKDSEADLETKSDFIGYEILTISKNRKILDTLIMKNNMKWYDLPHNKHFVRKAQGKYVKAKLEEMQK